MKKPLTDLEKVAIVTDMQVLAVHTLDLVKLADASGWDGHTMKLPLVQTIVFRVVESVQVPQRTTHLHAMGAEGSILRPFASTGRSVAAACCPRYARTTRTRPG
jgi:hypothetical protein